MYKVEIIIREETLEDVVDALNNIGYPGVSISTLEGRGQQHGIKEQFRGRSYTIPFLTKQMITVLIKENDLTTVKKTVIEAAKTGEPGDGKIIVTPVVDIVRIRTGENGEKAI